MNGEIVGALVGVGGIAAANVGIFLYSYGRLASKVDSLENMMSRHLDFHDKQQGFTLTPHSKQSKTR